MSTFWIWLIMAASFPALWLPFSGSPASAFSIELKGAAPLRLERQRAYTIRPPEKNNITPDIARIEAELAAIGAKPGDPVFLRVFKAETIVELWIRTGPRYRLFNTYPICFWSGTLGPKTQTGDRQTPEGFYTITRRGLHWSARWARSLNLGYPNPLDRRFGRTGSHILLHGGCSSIGCFSMTNRVMSKIHYIVRAAIRKQQKYVHVHVMPFRLTAANLARWSGSTWSRLWRELKPAYDLFEAARQPPEIGICGRQYRVRPAQGPASRETGPLYLLDGRKPPRSGRHDRHHTAEPPRPWACTPDTQPDRPTKTTRPATRNKQL